MTTRFSLRKVTNIERKRNKRPGELRVDDEGGVEVRRESGRYRSGVVGLHWSPGLTIKGFSPGTRPY